MERGNGNFQGKWTRKKGRNSFCKTEPRPVVVKFSFSSPALFLGISVFPSNTAIVLRGHYPVWSEYPASSSCCQRVEARNIFFTLLLWLWVTMEPKGRGCSVLMQLFTPFQIFFTALSPIFPVAWSLFGPCVLLPFSSFPLNQYSVMALDAIYPYPIIPGFCLESKAKWRSHYQLHYSFPFWSVVLPLIKWDVVSSLELLRKVLVGWKNTRGGLQNRNDLAKCIGLSNSALKATGCPYSLVTVLASGLRGILKRSVNSACTLVVGSVHNQTKQHDSTNCPLESTEKQEKEINAPLNQMQEDKNILNFV